MSFQTENERWKLRIPRNWQEFRRAFNGFDRWVNSITVLEVYSIFELYLINTFRFTLLSDAFLLDPSSTERDGLLVSSHRTNVDKLKIDLRVGKGTYTDRFTFIERFFNPLPASIRSKVADLDTLREFRNDVAHNFGIDAPKYGSIDYKDFHDAFRTLSIQEVPEQQYFDWLIMIDDLVVNFDRVFKVHLGEYERLQLAIAYCKSRAESGQTPTASDLRRHLSTVINMNLHSKQYNQELLNFLRDRALI